VKKDGGVVGGEEWREKLYKRGMEEASANGKQSLHSACANGIYLKTQYFRVYIASVLEESVIWSYGGMILTGES
jgi:hypothetical protein